MATWRGYEYTSPPMQDDPDTDRRDPNWHAITLMRNELVRKYKWARDMGVTAGDTYDGLVAKAILEFKQRAGIPVSQEELDTGYGIANLATRTRLGSYPPPPPPRHAILTFSGTWAAPGTGYCSWVAQACNRLVEEIPVQSPWSFGFVNGPIDSPSYRESVSIAVEWAVAWILAHPNRTILLAGYSQGAEAASRVYQEFIDGRLQHLRKNYVAGFTFGNPCRQKGHTFYLGKDPGGSGISSFNLSNMGNEWADYAQPGDIYTTKPGGLVGENMQDVYELAIDLQLNDPVVFFQSFIRNLLGLLNNLGGLKTIAPILSGLGAGPGGLVAGALSMIPSILIGVLGSLLTNADPGKTTDPIQAAIQACIIGLKFIAQNPPTAPHITYEFGEARPGQTYIQHAIQHITDWANRTPVRA